MAALCVFLMTNKDCVSVHCDPALSLSKEVWGVDKVVGKKKVWGVASSQNQASWILTSGSHICPRKMVVVSGWFLCKFSFFNSGTYFWLLLTLLTNRDVWIFFTLIHPSDTTVKSCYVLLFLIGMSALIIGGGKREREKSSFPLYLLRG